MAARTEMRRPRAAAYNEKPDRKVCARFRSGGQIAGDVEGPSLNMEDGECWPGPTMPDDSARLQKGPATGQQVCQFLDILVGIPTVVV